MRVKWLRFLLPVLLLHAPATAAWQEATSDHFRIYADAEPAAVRAYAEHLERFDGALRALRRVPKEGSTFNKLVIYALPNIDAVAALADARGSGVAGWYRPGSKGTVAVVPISVKGSFAGRYFTSDLVLLHEYTHHFFFRTAPGAYPAWFSEGYAEFFSTAVLEQDGGVVIGIGAAHRGYELGQRILTQDLLTSTKPPSMAGVYGKGWLLVHYLTFSPERAGQLARYLTAIDAGVPGAKAATDAFGKLSALEGEVSRYVRQKQLPSVRIAPERITPGTVTVREMTPAEQKMMPTDVRLRGRGEKAQAKLWSQAERDAAGTEGSAPAQVCLAQAELAGGRLDQAEAAAGRALAADPRSAPALQVSADIAIRRAAMLTTAATTTPATVTAWTEARRRVVLANRADPDAPGPLGQYYATFLAMRQRPSAAAIAGLRRAVLLAPEASNLRLLLARQAIADKDYPAARAALSMIAFAPHSRSASADAAAKVIALIDAGKLDQLVEAADAAFAGKDPEAEE